MIVESDRKSRNETELFYENEAGRIAMLNGGDVELSKAEMQMLIWIAGRTENMVENVVSVIRKAMTADVKRQEMSPVRRAGKSPRQGAKAAFDGRNGCQKCFCVTFDESNKAYAPYPALNTTRRGGKESY